jgi:hypothetical protein
MYQTSTIFVKSHLSVAAAFLESNWVLFKWSPLTKYVRASEARDNYTDERKSKFRFP